MPSSAKKMGGETNPEAIEPLPDKPFRTGVVSFLFDPESGLRWLFLCVTGYVIQVLVIYTLHFSSSDSAGQIAAVLLIMLLSTVGISFVVLASACFLAIVEDTANGLKKVENWPDVNFTEWALDSFYVINASFMSFMPGCLFGQVFVCLGLGMESALVTGAASMFVFFPPVLLASVQYGSSFYPGASNVWYSMRGQWKSWKQFYWMAMVLGAGCFLAHLLSWTGWMILGTIGSVVIVTLTMIYFRLLGRLSRIIDEKDVHKKTDLEDATAREEDEDAAQSNEAAKTPDEESRVASSTAKARQTAPPRSDLDLNSKEWDANTWSDLP